MKFATAVAKATSSTKGVNYLEEQAVLAAVIKVGRGSGVHETVGSDNMRKRERVCVSLGESESN